MANSYFERPDSVIELKKFLFSKKLQGKKVPMFNSNLDLAHVILDDKKNPYRTRSKNTVITSISQVVNAERRISEEMEQALVAAIQRRFAEEKNFASKAVKNLATLVAKCRSEWKGWSKRKRDTTKLLLAENSHLIGRLEHIYEPDMEVTLADLEYVLSLAKKSKHGLTLEAVISSLNKRKKSKKPS